MWCRDFYSWLLPLSKIEAIQYLWVFVDLEGSALLPAVWNALRLLRSAKGSPKLETVLGYRRIPD